MRRWSGVRLVGLLLVAAAVVGLAGAASAAAKQNPTVVLLFRMDGDGTVRINGLYRFTCAEPAGISCEAVHYFRRGSRVVIKVRARTGWKLVKWGGACKGTSSKCVLRPRTQKTTVTVRTVPPGDRLNPARLGTAATVNDGLGDWSMQVLSASQQGNDLVVDVKGTLSPSTANSWTFGLAYQAYVREGPKDEVPFGDYPQCPSADNSFLFVGSDVPPWGPGYVTGGQTVTGDLCFPIVLSPEALFFAPTDEFPPPAYPGPSDPPYPPPRGSVWFALR